MTCPDIKPKREQLSTKDKKPSLPIKMEWSSKKESEDVKIEPKEEVKEEMEMEMFRDTEKGDMMEQLATKKKMLHDIINQFGEQIAEQSMKIAMQGKKIAEKDELIGKYQQMCEGFQKSKHSSSGHLIIGNNCLHFVTYASTDYRQCKLIYVNFCAGMV